MSWRARHRAIPGSACCVATWASRRPESGFGKFLIGLNIGRAAIASSYGAASSLMVVLLWIYYSAQIFLIGAVFTKIQAFQRS